MSEKRTITEIAKDLEQATENLKLKCAATSRARSEETEWRNKVNGLQKEMDAAIASMKASAPSESDWAWKARNVGEDANHD